MKRVLFSISALALLCLPALGSAHPASYIEDQVWKHMGGRDAYKKVRYVAFTWVSETDGKQTSVRKQMWDRYTGDYVVEYAEGNGDKVKIYLNIDTKKGVAVRNGAVVSGEEGTKLVDRGYRIFINDTFWLLCPMKFQDWGARVKFEGHENVPPEFEWGEMNEEQRRQYARAREHDPKIQEMEQQHHDAPMIMHLWYEENVGLTPGDQYWFYVLHTGQIIKWHYKLEDGTERTWLWDDEKDCGMGITLATRRTTSDGDRTIYFSDVKFSADMDRSAFTPPQ